MQGGVDFLCTVHGAGGICTYMYLGMYHAGDRDRMEQAHGRSVSAWMEASSQNKKVRILFLRRNMTSGICTSFFIFYANSTIW